MSIINSFYLLFKSDTKDAVQGIKTLDDAQIKLQKDADKGEQQNKKINSEEQKRYKEKTKNTKETLESTKKLREAHEQLGESVLGTVAKLAAPFGLALGAFEIFNKAVGEARGVVSMNANLALMSKLTTQSVKDLSGINAVAKQFGGSGTEGNDVAQFLLNLQAKTGLKVSALDFLTNLQNRARGQTAGAQKNLFDAAGVPEALRIALLSTDNISELVRSFGDLTKATDQSAQSSLKFHQELDKLETTVGGFFTKALTPILTKINNYVDTPDGNKPVGLGYKPEKSLWDEIKSMYQGDTAPAPTPAAPISGSTGENLKQSMSGSTGENLKQSMSYWLSRGLTVNQAAGLVANEAQESGGNPNAIGDSGASVGAFQWSADRRTKILAGTGIDINTANHAQQLQAAEWELKQRGQWDSLTHIDSAEGAGAFISRNFEIPANGDFEAYRRAMTAGKIAIENADSIPAISGASSSAGGGNTIKIDNINIHTSATDADGIAKHVASAIETHINGLNSNYNTSILA